MCNGKHEFAHGTLTDDERKNYGVSVVICKNCEFRMICHNGPLTQEEEKWIDEVLARKGWTRQ